MSVASTWTIFMVPAGSSSDRRTGTWRVNDSRLIWVAIVAVGDDRRGRGAAHLVRDADHGKDDGSREPQPGQVLDRPEGRTLGAEVRDLELAEQDGESCDCSERPTGCGRD